MTAVTHDFNHVLSAWRRHPFVVLAIIACALLIATACIRFSVPQYTAHATIALDPRKPSLTRAPAVLADVATDATGVDTQVELIQSREVLGRAVELLVAAGGLRDPLTKSNVSIDALAAGLRVNRAGLTSAMDLSFTANEPAFAAAAVNAIATAYIQYQQALKQRATLEARQWLDTQIGASQQLLEQVSSAANRYRTQTGLIAANGTSSVESLTASRQAGLDAAEQDATDATARLFTAEQALQNQGATAAANAVDTPAMRELRLRFRDAEEHKAQLAATLGLQHPQLIEVEQQLIELRSQIDAEAHRAIDQLRSDAAVVANRVAGLQESHAQLRAQLANDSQAQVRLGELTSRANPMRRMYEDLLSRLQQTMAQQSLDRVNATIVSAAPIPARPSSPNTQLILAVAVACGFGAATLVAFLLHIFDSKLGRTEDVERRTRTPVIGTIPDIGRADLRIGGARIGITQLVPSDPSGRFADALRRVRLALPEADSGSRCLVAQFTSATFGEGKTVSAIGFAQAAATDGLRTLLIDADVRRASLTRSCNLHAEAGLIEVLAGRASLHDALVFDEGMQLHILPLSKYEVPSHDLFASRELGALLENLRAEFDLVVIDSAPALGVADSLALASRVDAVIVTARWAHTPVALVAKAIEAIQRVNGCIAGVVCTRVNARTVAASSSLRTYDFLDA